jgi:hypothetical protein
MIGDDRPAGAAWVGGMRVSAFRLIGRLAEWANQRSTDIRSFAAHIQHALLSGAACSPFHRRGWRCRAVSSIHRWLARRPSRLIWIEQILTARIRTFVASGAAWQPFNRCHLTIQRHDRHDGVVDFLILAIVKGRGTSPAQPCFLHARLWQARLPA